MKRLLLLLLVIISMLPVARAFDGTRAFVFIYGEGNDHYGYFIKMHDKDWGEFDWKGNRKKQVYTCIKDTYDEVILHDLVRKLYVRLTQTQCFLGKSLNSINDKTYDGEWRAHLVNMTVPEFKKLAASYFVYDKYGIKFIIARQARLRGQSIGWSMFDFSNWIEIHELYTAYQTPDAIKLRVRNSNITYKITTDKIYQATTDADAQWREWANGVWSNGIEYDAGPALVNSVQDSFYLLMDRKIMTRSVIKEKGLDSNKLKLVARDIARYYLARIKKDQLRYLDSAKLALSAYDKGKREAIVVYAGELYNVPMSAADYEKLKVDEPIIDYNNKDYYFNGKTFRMITFSMTDPVTKKTFKYAGKTKTMVDKALPLGFTSSDCLSIPMPSE